MVHQGYALIRNPKKPINFGNDLEAQTETENGFFGYDKRFEQIAILLVSVLLTMVCLLIMIPILPFHALGNSIVNRLPFPFQSFNHHLGERSIKDNTLEQDQKGQDPLALKVEMHPTEDLNLIKEDGVHFGIDYDPDLAENSIPSPWKSYKRGEKVKFDNPHEELWALSMDYMTDLNKTARYRKPSM